MDPREEKCLSTYIAPLPLLLMFRIRIVPKTQKHTSRPKLTCTIIFYSALLVNLISFKECNNLDYQLYPLSDIKTFI